MTRDADREKELAALVAEQDKDDRWGHRVDMRGPSLDFTFAEGGTFGDIVGYPGAGGETAVRKAARERGWTRHQILTAIRQWANEHGEPPRDNEWKRPDGRGVPATATVCRAFGSWNSAIESAGLSPRRRGGTSQNTPSRLQPRIRARKRTARLTTEQVAAAYALYQRRSLSMMDLADLLWEKFGYRSKSSCYTALLRAFHAEGFQLRTKSEAAQIVPAEKRRELARKRAAARWGERHPA